MRTSRKKTDRSSTEARRGAARPKTMMLVGRVPFFVIPARILYCNRTVRDLTGWTGKVGRR